MFKEPSQALDKAHGSFLFVELHGLGPSVKLEEASQNAFQMAFSKASSHLEGLPESLVQGLLQGLQKHS